ncbi:MAG: putative zinc-binding metallopeptidase [Ilumatobacteraceae bacterium]
MAAESVMDCPTCGYFVFLETKACQRCDTAIGFHPPTMSFLPVVDGGVDVDGERWMRCAQWDWGCNWLLSERDESARCFSCRLTRRRPENDDTIALEKLAETSVAKRRLIVQLLELGLPIVPFHERDGGLGFDLVSSRSGERVIIGHASGIITIDLAETLDLHREMLRISLGEPYRTMLGHFRHEIGHYYQWQLASEEPLVSECRALFGDERVSYSEAIDRHYRFGAPDDWPASYISSYATMHPWEDFAECFAHYLHITGTLAPAARSAVTMAADRSRGFLAADVVPRRSYADASADEMLSDWRWLSLMFNRINQTMGKGDLYPFTLVGPVVEKLAFVHRLVTNAAMGTTRRADPDRPATTITP